MVLPFRTKHLSRYDNAVPMTIVMRPPPRPLADKARFAHFGGLQPPRVSAFQGS